MAKIPKFTVNRLIEWLATRNPKWAYGEPAPLSFAAGEDGAMPPLVYGPGPRSPKDIFVQERSPPAPRPIQLPPCPELSPPPLAVQPDMFSLSFRGQPLVRMLTPQWLGLDDPELLADYDKHFHLQGEALLEEEGRSLTANFFVHMQLVATPQDAERLVHYLWPTERPQPQYFRDLAELPPLLLRQRVEAAAGAAGISLAPDQAQRAAHLLQLHGLEVGRMEYYSHLVRNVQQLSRGVSTCILPADAEEQFRRLQEQGLQQEAAAFFAAPGTPHVAAYNFSPEQAAAKFDWLLGRYFFFWEEAMVPPSLRDPGCFYPPPGTYKLAMKKRHVTLMRGDQTAPGYGDLSPRSRSALPQPSL